MSALPAECISFSEVEQLREARDILRQESEALAQLSRRVDTTFCAAVGLLCQCTGAVVVTGIGKAGLIGQKIAATLSSTGTRAFFLHPADAVHGDVGCIGANDVALALSNSGESEEIIRLLPLLKRIGIPIIALTGKRTSTLGSQADVAVTLGPIREAGQFGLAPTTSTTAMLALGDALAMVVSRARGFTRHDFAQRHPAGSLGRQLQCVQEIMRQGDQLRIAPETATVREVFVNMRKPGRRTGAVMLVDADGRLSGLFTDSDLVRLLETRRESQVDHPIAEVMTPRPKTVTAESPLADTIGILSQYRISELPVVDGAGRPIGLVDITDLIGLVPEEKLE